MYFTLRIISASAVMGYFVGRIVNRRFFCAFALSIAAFFLSYRESFSTEILYKQKIILSIFFGVLSGFLFSLPVLAADFIAKIIATNNNKAFAKSLTPAIALLLLISLLKLDYFPYFFSVLIKTKNFDQSIFQERLLDVFSLAMAEITSFLIPVFSIFIGTFLLFAVFRIFFPGFISLGLEKNVLLLLSLLVISFCFGLSTSFGYEFIHKIENALFK